MDKEVLEMLQAFKEDMRRDYTDFRGEIRLSYNRIETNVTNHLAHRLPTWATVVFALLTACIGALAALKF